MTQSDLFLSPTTRPLTLRGRPWPQPLAPWPAKHLGIAWDSYSIPVSIPCCTHVCWFNPYVRRLNPILHQNSFQWMICGWYPHLCVMKIQFMLTHFSRGFKHLQSCHFPGSHPRFRALKSKCQESHGFPDETFPRRAKHAAPSASSHPSGFWPAKDCKSLGKCFEKVVGGCSGNNGRKSGINCDESQ